MFGIDELAIQLEEPFSILPLTSVCDDIDSTLDQLVGEMRRQREEAEEEREKEEEEEEGEEKEGKEGKASESRSKSGRESGSDGLGLSGF